jgi:hypothetical protein
MSVIAVKACNLSLSASQLRSLVLSGVPFLGVIIQKVAQDKILKSLQESAMQSLTQKRVQLYATYCTVGLIRNAITTAALVAMAAFGILGPLSIALSCIGFSSAAFLLQFFEYKQIDHLQYYFCPP